MIKKSDTLIQSALLCWFDREGRELPWRRTRDPYAIWISEVMLQQTQVSRVIDYYERFLAKFPCPKILARAAWSEVLPYWRGLGYYQRGKNLISAAKVITEEWGGAFPKQVDDLRSLPGVGPYTAAAIASIAFNAPVAAIDTNLRRVISRLTGCRETEVPAEAARLFEGSEGIAGRLNQAFMDIGSRFCRSRAVDCGSCPLAKFCSYRLMPQSLPVRETRTSVKGCVHVAAACVQQDGRYLIAKRSDGSWEFPGGKREPGEDIRGCLKREIQEELGVEISVRPAFLTVDFRKRGKLHRLHFCRSQILQGKPRRTEHVSLKWVTPEKLSAYSFLPTNIPAIKKLERRFRDKPKKAPR